MAEGTRLQPLVKGLPPTCPVCGEDIPKLKAKLLREGLTMLPVEDIGLFPLMICEHCIPEMIGMLRAYHNMLVKTRAQAAAAQANATGGEPQLSVVGGGPGEPETPAG